MKTGLPSAYNHAIGWHGKLPTVGDFATRRLDTNFVGVWDDWLSAGLAKLRGQDESHWLDAYLSSPTWRFLMTPGFLPAPAAPRRHGFRTGLAAGPGAAVRSPAGRWTSLPAAHRSPRPPATATTTTRQSGHHVPGVWPTRAPPGSGGSSARPGPPTA